MAYKTVVVGTDGSITATAARDAAIRLVKRTRGRLVSVSAFGPPRITRQMAEGFVERARRAAERQGVEAVAELTTADPTEAILAAAERHEADLIVVGNKGMGDAARFKLASVPDRIAHAALCDVLIIDTTHKARSGRRPDRGWKKILVGTDGSPTAAEAVRLAFELAVVLRGTVYLVYVGDPIVGAIVLEEVAGGGPVRINLEPRVVQGDPADQICAIAETEDIDLVIVGNRGMSGARRYFLGSVPNEVAHRGPADVLIVKTTGRTLDDIEPGHGGVVDVGGRRLAVFRDEEGRVHAVSPRCTHMGCTVDWNDAERTWDCPCHGSRYDSNGVVLQGPAEKDLAPQDVG